ncbi:MAG: hypothetical protein M1571_01590 [Firmicutes bacterium]|nr:hypothetical protein [Bacillota bacterium]
MTKDEKGKDPSRKSIKDKACKAPRDCSVSEVTDSVEFASEPFDEVCRKKGGDNRDKRCR